MHQKTRLLSKRNEVFRVVEDYNSYISKIFTNEHDLETEIEMLANLIRHGVSVPRIIGVKGDMLLLEDLGHETLLDRYESWEQQNSKDYVCIMIKLCGWMKNFYNVAKSEAGEQIILSDVNFRNFIIKDGEFYGIDFEQSSTGHVETDIGKIIAYALTYDPVMTEWKMSFSKYSMQLFIEKLELDSNKVKSEAKKELERICDRRNISHLCFFGGDESI